MGEAYSYAHGFALSVPPLLMTLKLKRAALDKALGDLKQKNLISTGEIKMTARGGATKFLELTEEGIAYRNAKGLQVSLIKPGTDV